MRTTWNTGRAYTKEGQRITAQFIGADLASKGGRVYFLDIDRHIEGVYETDEDFRTAEQLQRDVMHRYDNGHWRDSVYADHEVFKNLWIIARAAR